MRTLRPAPAPVAAVRDEAGFEAAVREHWADLTRLAGLLAPPGAADDAVQDALVRAWRKRHQFDPARGSARVWLLAIVADQARRLRVRTRVALPLEGDRAVVDSVDAASRLDVRASVAGLPRRQHLAVVLFYYADLPVAQVALAMGCSEGTVKSTLSDARSRLRSSLGEG